jgi:creatinine amidohydrolase
MAASTSKGIYLEHLTWQQAEPVLRATKLVLLPLGARLKEHGLHLPLNNDWLLAEYLARRVVERFSVVVVPTLQYGYYPAFTEYPGSVSLRQTTCRDMVIDICRSLAAFGPRKFYVLNTGISTCAALEPARLALGEAGLVLEYTQLNVALAEVERAISEQPCGTHADEIETSMMLHIAPEIVKLERAIADVNPDRGPGGLTRNPAATQGVYSPSGAWGDPTLATREKGRIVIDALLAHLLDTLETLSDEGFVPAAPRTQYLPR